jgi:hypothetical protein
VTEVVGRATGVTVELDVERFGALVSTEVAAQLAALFPRDPAEFWAALCTQAHREQQRVAAMVDITCPHRDQCPYKLDILAGIGTGGETDDPSDGERAAAAPIPVDADRGDERDGVAG